MKSWKPLKKGDLVDLIAPGYPVTRDRIEKGIEILQSWGLRVREPADMVEPFYFHAQTDEKRLAFALQALTAKDSQAVWCVRGGYGANRLVPGLLKKKAPANAKLFVGISDITTLHSFLNQSWKWPTLHGPLIERLGSGTLPAEFSEECRQIAFGEIGETDFPNLQPMNAQALKKKKISGVVAGGNLTVLQSALATPLQPKLKGKILFLEDIGERGYRVDRMLEQFKQAGLFKDCEGVVFGHFFGGDEPGIPGESFIPFALQRFADGIKIPVWQGLEAGHGDRQRALPLGAPAILEKNTLKVKTGVR